jgi:hypothetical protein
MIARPALVLFLYCASAFAQVMSQQEILILSRIKRQMAGHLQGMPNYTCLETIERFQRNPKGEREDLIDVVRLEVALVEGKEMYAWPGSSRFEDRDLRQVVATGAFGTGAFALHARAVFLGDGTTFTFRGEEDFEGVKAWRFDFHTPQFRSGYLIRNPQRNLGAHVAYHGSFWANSSTNNVLRMEIVTEDIPAAIQITATFDRLDYQMVQIGSKPALLPQRSEVHLTDDKGYESINRIRLSRCRQFSGESTISFDDIDTSGVGKSAARRILEIPAGLELELALEEDIEHGAQAVGDKIQATVRQDVRLGKDVVIPKGAIAAGRIARMEFARLEYPVFNVTLLFDELSGTDFVAPLRLKMLRTVPSSAIPVESLRRSARGTTSIEIPVTDPNGFLRFTPKLRLPRGFVTVWETQKGTP